MEQTKSGLAVVSLTLGPALTNAYLLADQAEGVAVAIDPAWDGGRIADEAAHRGWRVTDIWLTHAHFDHFGGAAELSDRAPAPLPVALHLEDYPLWKALGGAPFFGMPDFDPGPEPTVELDAGMILHVGSYDVEVRHAPGHTPGHVLFCLPKAGLAFCGDVIFEAGVGRTDLPGGDWTTLLTSIREQVLTLPDETTLFPGHGRATTVGRERSGNPFLDPTLG
ncbi:MAG TPA: MBL fold metallo-hydrolase [Anaerolineales bacterium]|nr:MBL fold metallo-hydrolase [Anaerolineales bacterium]